MLQVGKELFRIVLGIAVVTLIYTGSALAQANMTPQQQQQQQQLRQNQTTAQTALNNQQSMVNQSNAVVNNAQTALNNANNGVTAAQQGATNAQAAVTQAQNALQAAQASNATAAQLASLQADVAAAQNNLTAQQAALANANAALAPAQGNLDAAQQQLDAANAMLALAQAQAQAAAQAANDFQNALVAARIEDNNITQDIFVDGALAVGNLTQNVLVGGRLAFGNMAQNALVGGRLAMGNLAQNAALSTMTDAGGCTVGTLGGMLCNIIETSTGGVGIITGFAYMAGLICGFLGVLKLRQHVESPNQVEIWDPIKRFVAGGAFFALPYIASVLAETIEGAEGADVTGTGFNGASSGVGLDAMIVALMSNIGVPSVWIIGWFGWIAGLIFVFIGISRLMQTEQQGPKGPTGIGTIMTFLVAGCLFSLNSIVAYLNGSVFNTDLIATDATLQYTAGLGNAEAHVHAVISAIIMFSIVVGWVSIVRGLFIVRGVSEGNSQASMMAAITHMVGGILAVNLGAVIMAVQNTLGIADYGIVFAGAP